MPRGELAHKMYLRRPSKRDKPRSLLKKLRKDIQFSTKDP
jgi:hypothetical protein